MGDPEPTSTKNAVGDFANESARDQKADNYAKPHYDSVLISIINYVYDYEIRSPRAMSNAKIALVDALGCALESLHESQQCALMVGPVSPGIQVSEGFRLPGTQFQMEPLKGAFDLGAMIRYLDHNDAYPGAEWGHPSDNIGAILAVADWQSRLSASGHLKGSQNGPPLTMGTVLSALIKAYEIQGCFQIRNAFNKVGLDHTILVKVASTAVVPWLLGLSRDQALDALSHAWMDGHPLRVYRQAPNAGPRKGWAAGDACMRAVHLALLVRSGQPGAPSVLTTPRWGFYDALFKGKQFELPRPFSTWTIENIVFKVYTAEGHALTAVEAALKISEMLKERNRTVEEIARIHVRTQEAAMIIINKQGPLKNPADRDHCMQYMVATVILKGQMIETADYQDVSPWANNPGVEQLRTKIDMAEDPQLTKDYHDPEKRSCTNALTVTFTDGTSLPEVVVEYPLGSAHRGEDTVRAVQDKARRNLGLGLGAHRVDEIIKLASSNGFEETPVHDFVDLFVP